ncbi:MAG: Rieske 2Fe-2S domain-containing protein, partial [Actinomycetota bacterium]
MSPTAKDVVPPELRRGLLHYWYPICRSEDLGSEKPLGLKRVGEDLVLWRDAEGAAHVFTDRCAHRHAPLSIGDVVDGRLQCRYHGLQYDGTGQCRLVPLDQEMDGPQARGLRVASYPTEERGGLVWAYIGDVEMFPPPPLWTDPALTDPSFAYFIGETTWDANWLLVHDNTSDPAHVGFLHGQLAARINESGLVLEPLG